MNRKENVILDPWYANLQILGQITPGQVIAFDDVTGNWNVVDSSSYSVIWNNVKYIAAHLQYPQQRRERLSTELARICLGLVVWCENTMEKSVVERCTDEATGKWTMQKFQALGMVDREKMEEVFNLLECSCKHLLMAIKGMEILQNSVPYKSDASFKANLEIHVSRPITEFLEKILRRASPDFEDRILGKCEGWKQRIRGSDQAERKQLHASALTTSPRTYGGTTGGTPMTSTRAQIPPTTGAFSETTSTVVKTHQQTSLTNASTGKSRLTNDAKTDAKSENKPSNKPSKPQDSID